jgi:hypothetical protein
MSFLELLPHFVTILSRVCFITLYRAGILSKASWYAPTTKNVKFGKWHDQQNSNATKSV